MTQKFMFQIQVILINNKSPTTILLLFFYFFVDLNYDSINENFITGEFQIQNTNDEDDLNKTLEAGDYEEQFNMGEVSIFT